MTRCLCVKQKVREQLVNDDRHSERIQIHLHYTTEEDCMNNGIHIICKMDVFGCILESFRQLIIKKCVEICKHEGIQKYHLSCKCLYI